MEQQFEKDLGEGIKVRVIKEDSASDGGWIWGFAWYDQTRLIKLCEQNQGGFESYADRWTRRTPSLTQSQIAEFALWLCLPGHPGSPHRGE